jgi:hypothetical protein
LEAEIEVTEMTEMVVAEMIETVVTDMTEMLAMEMIEMMATDTTEKGAAETIEMEHACWRGCWPTSSISETRIIWNITSPGYLNNDCPWSSV